MVISKTFGRFFLHHSTSVSLPSLIIISSRVTVSQGKLRSHVPTVQVATLVLTCFILMHIECLFRFSVQVLLLGLHCQAHLFSNAILSEGWEMLLKVLAYTINHAFRIQVRPVLFIIRYNGLIVTSRAHSLGLSKHTRRNEG